MYGTAKEGRRTMKRLLTILTVAGLLALLTTAAVVADDVDTQTVTCTVNGLADAIEAPDDVALSCDRLSSAETAGEDIGTITYGAEADTRDVTVVASSSGAPVAGAKLWIKSTEDLSSIAEYTLLATGSDTAGAVTLKENVVPANSGTTLADDIFLKLDASEVVAGAANLGTPWTYTLTYTLGDLQ